MKKLILNLIGIAFMIMLNVNYIGAQFECAVESPESVSSPTDYIDGPLYVKLYLMVVRNDDGSGGWSDALFDEYLGKLDEIYGVHDIHFNICVSDIKDSYWANKGFNLAEFINYIKQEELNYSDGIIGLLQLHGPRSMANGQPGKRFIATSPAVATHELGHCLGLFHTFNQNVVNGEYKCVEHAPYYDGNNMLQWGDNASEKGDFVYDTPADITTSGDGPDCDKTGLVWFQDCKLTNPNGVVDDANPAHEFIDVEDPDNPGLFYLGNNIMNYGFASCHKLITPGQAERIRGEITKIKEVTQDEPKTIVFNRDFVLTSNKTWNYDRIINGDVTLLGSGLTIQGSNIYFAPNHGIKLSPNSYLFISSSTLDVSNDNNCYSSDLETWKGIEYDFTLSSDGVPWIQMGNSVIKNAETALSNNSFSQNNSVQLWVNNDSKFIDNKRALDLTNVKGIIYFFDCDFEYNKSFDDPKSSQIRLTNSKGFFGHVNILNTTDDVYFSGVNGFDIFNSNVGFYTSKIDGWYNGIRRGYGTGKSFKIRGVEITNNEITGIDAFGRYGTMQIKNCDVSSNYYGGLNTYNSVGTDLKVEGNLFSNAQSGVYIQRNSYGYFYNNIFDNIDGNALYFKNSHLIDKALFLCNQMNSTGIGHIITYGGIAPVQANIGDDGTVSAAGNTFASISGYNFAAHTDIEPLYFYYGQNPAENPVNNIGINLQLTMNAAECSENQFDDDNGDNGGGLGNGDTSDEDNKYTEKKGEKDDAQDTLDTNLDGGSNGDIIDIIDDVTEVTSDDVTGILTDLGPWLSDVAAEEVLQYANVFTGDQLVSIFTANPDVMFNPVVYQFAFGDNSTLSQYQQDVLHSVYGTLTDRTRLEVKLRYLDEYISHIINKAIGKVVFTDDGTVDYDNLRMWFDRKGTFDSKFDIAETYVTQGDFDGAVSYLQGVLTQSGLSTDQIQEINDYISIFNLLDNAYQTGRYEGQLTTEEIAQLESFANTSKGLAQNKAQGILNFFYGYTFDDDEELDERSKEYKKVRISRNIQNIEVNPNPSGGEFAIELKGLPVDITISNVKVLSLEGKVIFDNNFKDKLQKVNIALDNAKSGIYLYKVRDTSGKIHLGKLILNSK